MTIKFPIGVRDHRVVRQYEDRVNDFSGEAELPCPACGIAWIQITPTEGALYHAPRCDFMRWLREPDPDFNV